MSSGSVKRSDAAALLFFLLLVSTFFAPVLFGGATLLPFDNLYRFPPWEPFAAQLGVAQPHNELLSDLVLENYPWKKFIADSLRQGELPLWNPYILAGQPFLAAGQNATLYPLGLIFYLLPLTRAYGIFIALHFWIAAASMYLLGRVLRISPFAATISGVVYAFSGFMVVSVVFPMIVSAAAWLPAILAMVELALREEEKRRADPTRQLFFAALAAILLGLQFLAGHVEVSYYVLMVLAFYSAWRVLGLVTSTPPSFERRGRGRLRLLARVSLILGATVALGLALAAIQLIPLYELVQRNFRAGLVSYDQVAGWALPARQIITFIIPDFFGNPAHHSYFDIFDRTIHVAPTGTIFWGIKNYVEAGSYISVLALVLALIALASTVRFYVSRFTLPSNSSPAHRHSQAPTRSSIVLFGTLALLSLLFAFGTPLYALLFYGLPGYNQLHTAFRWIFPFTLSLAFLAGAGAHQLSSTEPRGKGRAWGWLLIALGGIILAVLALSLVWREPFLRIAEAFVARSDLARPVFETGQAFWSYQFRNFFLLAIFLMGAGAVLRISRCAIFLPARLGGHAVWKPFALLLVVLDLFVFGMDFNPASDARLAEFTPPAIQFLQNDHSLFRITSYDLPGQKVFNPNVGMYYGIQDIRGYDSIIPKQYADYMSALAPQDELLYNRIAPFYAYQSLSSQLLNLLNVKYVLTTRAIPNPGYKLVYDNEIQIYENLNVMPRAFMVKQATVIADRAELLRTLGTNDRAQEVLLEEQLSFANGTTVSFENPGGVPLSLPVIDKYSGSEIIIKTDTPQPAFLVLTDSYFPGWIAQIDGEDTKIYRADYNFRAVLVSPGAHVVRFKYSPLSFKVGAVTSLVAFLIVLLGLVALAWRRFAFATRNEGASNVRVVAKNSLVPMAASFLNQGLSFAFALVMLRVLGPTNAGRYAFATTVWFFLNSVTDFGLGILMTREVSRERALANRYLTNTAVLRILLTFVSVVPLALLLLLYTKFSGLTSDTVFAILLLWASLFPANLAASLSYLFNAYERFEYPTAVGIATALLSVSLQVVALLSGFGIVGLAAVSIISNVFTLAVMYWLVRGTLFKPRWEFDAKLTRWMFFESYPLMLNNLLASLFFRIDVFLLQPLKGDLVLGYYSTAYKFINALNFIPSNFTLAIFPLLSRYATSAKDATRRALIVAVKLLLWISLPITIVSVFIARELILFFGGAAYLPDSPIALQWLIWFLPFSFVNSVVHYVLIALNQQRFLTKAFLIGLGFNLIANLIAIPALSYRGAALVTVLSEMALLIPFYYSLRQHLGTLPILDLLWRPIVAAVAMGGALYFLLPRVNLLIALALASIVYVVALLALGALGEDERLLLRRLVPQRFERALAFVLGVLPQ